MSASVAPGDQEGFARLVLDEFKTLHAGNAVRFGLRPLEFEAWRATTLHAGNAVRFGLRPLEFEAWRARRTAH